MATIGPSTQGTAWFLDGISNLQSRQAQVQRELSSGIRVQDAADSPLQTPELIHLSSSLASVQAYQTNLSRVQTEANAADQSLGAAITLIQNAQSIAVQAANFTTTAATRLDLAAQIQGIQQQLVSISNTTVEGRYIFGGDQDQAPPYAFDESTATGVDTLTAASSSRVIIDPQGQPVFLALTAQQIFDPGGAGGASNNRTFAALQSLVTALQANDTAGISNSLASLDTASVYVSQQQVLYGVAEQRITNEQNTSSSQATALQAQISGIRDTNFVEAATELTQLTTDQSAAFGAQASVSRKSLFDYLG